ncbi:hypothetical protein K0651_09745 [Ornithinimicrobium sp. Arc0846-15]|nr:hypothetical protein [Ornithinimicrobium laminariae]
MSGNAAAKWNIQTGLIALALLVAVGYGIADFDVAYADAGSYAYFLFGVPILCALVSLAVAVELSGALRILGLAVLGVIALGWGVLHGLGSGLIIIIPGLLLVLSAALQPLLSSGSSPSRT